MRTKYRFRIGLLLALMALLTLDPRTSGSAFARDEPAPSAEAAQAVAEEERPPPTDTTPPSLDQPADVSAAAVD